MTDVLVWPIILYCMMGFQLFGINNYHDKTMCIMQCPKLNGQGHSLHFEHRLQ